MTQDLFGVPFHLGMIRDGNYKFIDNIPQHYGSSWYFSRKEIEGFSPSRIDGIDLKEESELRMCYCSFLKDFGMRLGVVQVTIATAIMFCHRFYLHQSHAKNDWQTIATVCMFLASKVEDTPLLLDKVVIASYETIHRKDPAIARRIHQKDVFEKQKALILIGERLLLSTIRFDFNIQHPYRPLLEALKKFGMTQKDVRQVAWNFVNDSLRTTLCLQYKPHYIAAGSVFLAAKLRNVKLPSERGYVWWHEFDVTPRQLHAAIQEMMELLGYKRRPVVTHALEKPTQTPLLTKEEASSSPDSCVLSRPGSSRSTSSQRSDGDAGGQRPVDLVIPNICSNSNPDGKHSCVDGTTERQCQARDSESPDSIVENCQGSGEGAGRTGMSPEQVVNIEDCHRSGDAMNQASMKSELVADTISCENTVEHVDQSRTRPEQITNIKVCQGSGEDVDQARTIPEQVASIEDCQGSNEGVNEARITPGKVSKMKDCQGSGEGVNQAPSYLEQVLVDPPRTNPEVVILEDCQGSFDDGDKTRTKHEQVADGRGRIDMDRIKAMVKKRKRQRETSKRVEAIDDSSEDAWIERELEIGVELTAKSAEKKQRLLVGWEVQAAKDRAN